MKNRLATRICAELGTHYIKTYYIEDGFETVTASCPVPIVMAGGKKIPEFDALNMAYRAIQEGASGEIEVDDMIMHTLLLDDIEKGFQLVLEGKDSLKVIILPNQ